MNRCIGRPVAAAVVLAAVFLLGPASPRDRAVRAGRGGAVPLRPGEPGGPRAVPDTPWVIVSSMIDEGYLYAADTRDHSAAVIYPLETSEPRQDTAVYGACPGPVSRQFRPHGLYLRPGEDDRHTLLVVGHGAREAIEVFEVDMTGSAPALTWVGCAVAPEPLALNSVVALPDGGIVATSPRTGDIWEWQGGTDWSRVPGSEDIGPNGLEISEDGEWFYVGGYGRRALIRLSRGRTPVEQEAVDVGFHIDNVRQGPGNTLLAAGHIGPTREAIGACIREGECEGVTSRVARIDLDSLTAEEVVRYPSNDLLILGTVAIQVNDEIWVGQVAEGDRIARFPAPPR